METGYAPLAASTSEILRSTNDDATSMHLRALGKCFIGKRSFLTIEPANSFTVIPDYETTARRNPAESSRHFNTPANIEIADTKLRPLARKFPLGFFLGVATSDYQIEGAWNEDGKTFKRTPKLSAELFHEISANNAVM